MGSSDEKNPTIVNGTDDHVIENELDEKELKDSKAKSWFLMLANPQEIYLDDDGNPLSPESICDILVNQWCQNIESRSALVAYCISKNGFIHCHMCFYDNKDAQRFSAVKKLFPKANIRASKGTKAQIEDYIYKRGKYEEKGERVVCTAQRGDIQGRQGQRNDLENIRDLVQQGYTPEQIFNSKIGYRRYEKMVRDEFNSYKLKTIPLLRDVNVVWHIGASGSGKSYEAVKLSEAYGRNNIYIVNNYSTGMFDKYSGQEILFLDEFKGGISYQELLVILDRYTTQLHCRYTNNYMFWKEVHITSVFSPETIYNMLVYDNKHVDTYEQLKRRISTIVYHWKDEETNEFHEFSLPMSEYKDYEQLQFRAKHFEFKELNKDDDLPFTGFNFAKAYS